jgi:hypothetical protein
LSKPVSFQSVQFVLNNMDEVEPGKLEKPSERKPREMATEAYSALRNYAGLRWPTLNHKGRMSRLAGVLNLGHRRVRSLYQNEPGVRVRADEMERIQRLEQARAEGTHRDDIASLQNRIARLEAVLFERETTSDFAGLAHEGRRAGDRRRGDDATG